MSTSIRTLIVDDDVATRIGVRTILSSEPSIEVVGEAATAKEATELVAALAPDVVLMDVLLPDGDGIEATAGITADGHGTPKVIVLTTFDFDEYAYRALRAGASGFLLKRIRAEELIEAVLAVASGAALPTPEATTRLIERYASLPTRAHVEFRPALTDRETDVLVLIARGCSNQEIATDLGISLETVRTHVKHVYAKCGARDRAQAVIAAYDSGLVSRFS